MQDGPRPCQGPFPFHNHRTWAEVHEDHLEAIRLYRARQRQARVELEHRRFDEVMRRFRGFSRSRTQTR